eukprot:tig00020902_g14943.t1
MRARPAPPRPLELPGVAYFGKTGEQCRDVLGHFAALGYPCPPLRNPADHILDCVQGKVEREGFKGPEAAPLDFAEAWRAGERSAAARREVAELNAAFESPLERHEGAYATGLGPQLRACLARRALQLWRDPILFWARFLR